MLFLVLLWKFWKVNKVTKSDKDGNRNVVVMYYKIKFICSGRFIETSLSNLIDKLTGGVNKTKYKECN